MQSLSSSHRLELMLLGGFDARLNGVSITGISYAKMRALLAYLAMEREQDHNREVLAELLWSENDPTTARGNLRRTLSDLRRVLESPTGKVLFSTSKHTIRFIPDFYIDALHFTRQVPASPESRGASEYNDEKVIDLYRGELLAGLSLPDSPDFEEWLQIRRESLHRRALVLLEQLSNCHKQIGNYSRALQFALRQMELEPWDENNHRRVMRLYALNGQKKASIDQYEACCRLLKKELGVLPNEETRHLAERIRNDEVGRRATDTVAPPLKITPQPPAERRQVTVLYCELSLAAIDDPDEALELLRIPQARCVEVIRRFSGHIVQTHGGGLLSYFGYPQAHEDAARHAVQAALTITQENAYGIEIRAGVHTGLIITGGDSSVPDTVGKTSKLAIQLRQSVAQTEVAISQETHRVVGGYFDCESLGTQPLPGFAQPLEIFKVVRESGARTRLEAAAHLTPLVGRETEIGKLLALWGEAVQGRRNVVLIQGEAGIGKSRLLHTLKERLADEPHAIRELRCFSEFSQSPFYPLIVMLEAIFDFEHGDTPELKFDRLVQHLETHCTVSVQDAVPLLAQLLSLPLGGDYQTPGFSPQKQKELTIAILLDMLQALAAKQPALLIVEDLHWIDHSSLELLARFVEQTGSRPILAVLTARPEFDPPWNKALESTLTLAPLVENEVAKIITSIGENIPAEIIRRIVERADGVPLFAEEMAKIAATDNQAIIPATLHDLLAARIDNMGEAKYTAQLAASIGREFDLGLLRKISPYAVALAHNLDNLQDAGLIFKVNKTAYQFKHALIQEAAYQSQTKTGRQSAHQRIAQTLLSDFPDVVATLPEVIAQHLSSGGKIRQSFAYWIKAGQRASRRSAHTEATEHFNSGLRLVESLPPDTERDRIESELRLNLGMALVIAKGYGSAEAGDEFSRTLELGNDSADLFKALWGMWFTSSSRISHLYSLELAENLLLLAGQNNDPMQLHLAHYAKGNSSFMTGNQSDARTHLEQSISLYLPSFDEAMASEYGENIGVSSLAILSLVLWLQGFSEQAEMTSQRALNLARRVDLPHSLGYALCIAAVLNRWLKQFEATTMAAQEGMALAQTHGFPLWMGLAASSSGWVQAMQGQVSGVAQIQKCLDGVNDVMSGARVFFLAPLCEALVHLGQFDAALTKINEALVIMDAKDSRFFESDFHRLRGVCLFEISTANAKEAEACFNMALAISRKQHAKSLELRAVISMARLWQQQGKQADARQPLHEIYDGFAECFDTHDLREAAELLRTLA